MPSWQPSRAEARHRWILTDGRRHRLGLSTMLKIGPGRMLRGVRTARQGGRSMAEALPVSWLADAMTHGIVNAPAAEVDADLLMPTMARYGAAPPMRRRALARAVRSTYPGWTPGAAKWARSSKGWKASWKALVDALDRRRGECGSTWTYLARSGRRTCRPFAHLCALGCAKAGGRTRPGTDRGGRRIHARRAAAVPVGYGPCAQTLKPRERRPSRERRASRRPRTVRPSPVSGDGPPCALGRRGGLPTSREADAVPCEPVLFEVLGTRRVPHVRPGHMRRVAEHAAPWSWIGWSATGVAITHVVSEAERLADLMRQKPAQ